MLHGEACWLRSFAAALATLNSSGGTFAHAAPVPSTRFRLPYGEPDLLDRTHSRSSSGRGQ